MTVLESGGNRHLESERGHNFPNTVKFSCLCEQFIQFSHFDEICLKHFTAAFISECHCKMCFTGSRFYLLILLRNIFFNIFQCGFCTKKYCWIFINLHCIFLLLLRIDWICMSNYWFINLRILPSGRKKLKKYGGIPQSLRPCISFPKKSHI